VHLAQPTRVRQLVGVLQAPAQLGLSRFALAKVGGQLGAHDARHPVCDEGLALRQARRLVEHRQGVAHPADALQKWHGRGTTGS